MTGVSEYRLGDGSKRWRVRLYHQGTQYKWSGFTTKGEASAWYQDRKRDIREGYAFPGPDATGILTGEILARYRAQSSNKKNVKNELPYAVFWTDRLGARPLQSVTSLDIEQARTHLLKIGYSARGPLSHATVNRYVAWLRHVCQIEVDGGRLARNPCAGLKFKERGAPEREYSDEQLAALSRELGDEAVYPAIAVMTGLRQGEQFRLRCDDLDLERGIGRLLETKSGETQFFAISSAAAALFRPLIDAARELGSPWVFPDPRDAAQPLNYRNWYKWRFVKAAARAGIKISRRDGHTWHTLRHTFASRLQDAGGDIRDIKTAGRWKSWGALDRYVKRKDDRVRALVERLRYDVPSSTAVVPNLSIESTGARETPQPETPITQ